MSQPGAVPGAVFEFHAARARLGRLPGVNDPLTAQAFDTSGSGNHGTLESFSFPSTGGWDGIGVLSNPYALAFDGIDDYVGASLIGACADKVFTYEAWMRTTSFAAVVEGILAESDRGITARTVQLCLYAGYAYGLWIDDAYGATLCGGETLVNDGQPHHLVMSVDGTHMQLYVDDVASGPPVDVPAASFAMTTAGYGTLLGGAALAQPFPGSIAVARIYPFCLTDAQVAQNTAAGYLWTPDPGLAEAPLAHDWQAALEAPTRVEVVTCTAYLGGSLVGDVVLTDGSVTADCRRATMRTCSLTIAPSAGLTHAETYELLSTPGLELRLRRGVQYADGLVETVALGSFVVDELSYSESGSGQGLTAQCSDVSVRVQRAVLVDPYSMAAGGSLADLVAGALRDRDPQAVIGFTSATVPDDLTASVVLGLGTSSNPWSELQDVMLAHGYLLYLSADGAVVAAVPVDPDNASPTYIYRRGAAALVTERTRTLPLASAYNGVIVTGEGSGVASPVRGEAWDTDPRSPTYYLGPFGRVPQFVSSPLVTSELQAETLAAMRLSLMKGRRDEYSFTALVRPELAPLDVIGVERESGAVDVYVIDQVTTPLSPTAMQTAITRSSVAET